LARVILRSVSSFDSRVPLLLLAAMFFPKPVQAQTTVDIHAIQTSLPASPYLGQSVTTSGIVIGVLTDGFYIENPDSDWDNSIATAEGIFVYTSGNGPLQYAVDRRYRSLRPVARI
jgi:predicted extracellular nuclease